MNLEEVISEAFKKHRSVVDKLDVYEAIDLIMEVVRSVKVALSRSDERVALLLDVAQQARVFEMRLRHHSPTLEKCARQQLREAIDKYDVAAGIELDRLIHG